MVFDVAKSKKIICKIFVAKALASTLLYAKSRFGIIRKLLFRSLQSCSFELNLISPASFSFNLGLLKLYHSF